MITPSGRKMARAVAALAVAEILAKVATLVTFMLIARVLGAHSFGLFTLGLSVGVLLGCVSALGMDVRLIQLSGQDKDRLPSALATVIAIRGSIVLVLLAVTVAVLAVRQPMVHVIPIAALVAAALTDTLSDAYRAASASRGSQEGPALALIAQRFFALALVGLVLWLRPSVEWVAVAYLLASMLGCTLMYAGARRVGVRPDWRGISRANVHDFLRAMPVSGVNEIVSMALFRLDAIILAALAGVIAVAHYNAAYRLLETVLFVSWSLGRALLPSLADATVRADSAVKVLRDGNAFIALIYLPYGAFLAVFGDQLVGLLFGEELQYRHLLVWLALAPWFFGCAHLAATGLLARRPDPIVLMASLAALVVNVVLNLLLIPLWQPVGAAIATTVSYGVQMAVNGYGLRRRYGSFCVDRGVTIALCCAVAMGAVMLLPLHPVLGFLLGGLVFVGLWDQLSRRFDPQRRRRTIALVRRERVAA